MPTSFAVTSPLLSQPTGFNGSYEMASVPAEDPGIPGPLFPLNHLSDAANVTQDYSAPDTVFTRSASSQSMTGSMVATSLPLASHTQPTKTIQPSEGLDSQIAKLTSPQTTSAPASDVIFVRPGTTASELQKLIDTAPAGTTLQLEAGHYKFDKTITINRDDISVVGAGSDKTFIEVPSSLGEEAFQIGGGGTKGEFTLAEDMTEGGTVMTLTGSHNFVVGDHVYLERESTKEFYEEIGDTEWANTDVPLRTSIAQVVAVDGLKITLSTGVHFDFTTGETTVKEIAMAENVKVGGFTVDYGLATADPSNFANTLSAYSRNAVIEVDGTAGLVLFDITSHDVPSLGVNVASSTNAKIDSITMTGAHNKGDGGNGYGLQIRDVYDSSFANLSDMDMRHSVVFASWTSAAGNFVHVAQTDRDINFHGGRDHDNVVVVDNSLRDANSDIIAPTLFINTEGTHYGSVTAASANTGYDSGSSLSGMGGNDSLTGGAGNDLLIGGSGKDTLNGMGGEDIVDYSGNYANFTITSKGNGVYEVKDKVGDQSIDQVSGVEWLVFDDKVIDLRDMSVKPLSAVEGVFDGAGTWQTVAPAPVPIPVQLVGTSGKDVFEVTATSTTVKGLGGSDTVHSTVSFTLSDDVERLDLTGTASINGTGNVNAEQIFGNDAANKLQGLAGADKIWGKGGNDTLSGGADKDMLYGDAGNDRIDGGAAQDKLTGGAGADVFVFTLASDTERHKSDKILDFETRVDKIDLTAIDADTTVAGNQAFVYGTSAAGSASLWMKSGYIYGDTNDDGVADLAIYVKVALGLGDILL
jgi:Ca2+-binding RTX toxin-like protein